MIFKKKTVVEPAGVENGSVVVVVLNVNSRNSIY
jgi:hypothetical protein